MGKWLPFDPSPDSEAVKDSQYANEELNNMMKTYMENQEKAKIYHEQRKQEMVRTTILDNLQSRKDTLSDLEKNLDKAQLEDNKNEVLSIEQNMKALTEQIKTMEGRKTELDEQIDNLNNQIKSFNPLTNEK
jgi:DNA repair exonuclease SbcCD ATPase subunit